MNTRRETRRPGPPRIVRGAIALSMLLGGGCPTPADDDDSALGDDRPSIDDDDDAVGDDDDLVPDLDVQLAALFESLDVPPAALEPVAADPAQVALGEALFFDPILSGNKDVACASCHHPSWGTSDGLSLTLGVGATGTGPDRADGLHPPFVPRHAMDLYNRGDAAWRTLFWDGRVERTEDGVVTPAGLDPLPGLSGVLAAQALVPLLDPAEMRGQPGDTTVVGPPNEIGALTAPAEIWAALLDRLLAVPAYVDLFAAAWPDVAVDDLTFAHAANAIAAYEADAFSFTDTPWDRYLRGDLDALRDVEKLGAMLFYGVAGCGGCHSGALMSDQAFHATGVVQLGPGQPGEAPFDTGRRRISGEDADRFAFRTPPLRNVALSAPYMHDGALLTLQDVVLHYADVERSAADYDPSRLHPDLAGTVQQGEEHLAELLASLSPEVPTSDDGRLSIGLSNIREFLEALTDPAALELASSRPATVPSGLPVP
jgi:cytochrome c peroxidase